MEEKIIDTVTGLEMERRLKLREERERRKKEAQRRYYIVGEIFCKHFPVVNNLPPGTQAQNTETFLPLEKFLESIATRQKNQEKLTTLITGEKIRRKLPVHDECVSGHTESKEVNPDVKLPHGSREFSARETAIFSQMLELHQRSKGKG